MNFFQTVFALCSGTSVFLRLTTGSLMRACWHTLLLVILCALFITGCRIAIHGGRIQEVSDRFFNLVTGVELSDKGIALIKNPEKPESFILSRSARFHYFPNETLDVAAMDSWNASYGLICTTRGAAIWFKQAGSPDHSRYGVSVVYDLEQFRRFKEMKIDSDSFMFGFTGGAKNSWQNLSASEVNQRLREKMMSKPGTEFPDVPSEKLTSSRTLVVFVLEMFGGFMMAVSLFQIVMFLLISVAAFSVAQFIRFSALPKKLTYRMVLVLTLYAAFPPILIASLYTAFDLPFLSYELIFFIAFFLYQMTAFNSLMRTLNPPQEPEPGDDSDF